MPSTVQKMHQLREGSLGFQSRTPRGRPVCSRAARKPVSGSRGLRPGGTVEPAVVPGALGEGLREGDAPGTGAVGVAVGADVGCWGAEGAGGGGGPAGGGVGGVLIV